MAEYLTFQQYKKTSYRSLSHKNFIKDKMTGRVDIVWSIFENISKVQIEVTGPNKKHNVCYIYQKKRVPVLCFQFELFPLFLKMRQSISTIPVILSLMKICVARTVWYNFT